MIEQIVLTRIEVERLAKLVEKFNDNLIVDIVNTPLGAVYKVQSQVDFREGKIGKVDITDYDLL